MKSIRPRRLASSPSRVRAWHLKIVQRLQDARRCMARHLRRAARLIEPPPSFEDAHARLDEFEAAIARLNHPNPQEPA